MDTSRQRIHVAARNGDVKRLRRELRKGVSPDVFDGQGLSATPLYLLCESNARDEARLVACMKLLIEAGADLNLRDERGVGWAPLHVAATHDHPGLVACLLEAGANVNRLSRQGQSPLYIAIECRGSPDCVALLIRAGAAVNVRDNSGRTPLDIGTSTTCMSFLRSSPVRKYRNCAHLLRAGATLPAETEDDYLRKVIAAGSFRNYERAHLNALAGTFAPKFSRLLPPEMVRRVLEFAYPVGDH